MTHELRLSRGPTRKMKCRKNRTNINLAVGRSCFVKCAGCYNQFASNPELIANEDILSFLKYARKRGVESVTYCGGDPMSRPGFLELLINTKKLGFIVKVDTVGTPFLGNANTIFFGRSHVEKIDVENLVGIVDLIGIPLDGSNEKTIGQFRTGRDGFLQEQMEILELLTKCGLAVSVNTVVTKKNMNDMVNIGNLIHSVSENIGWEMFQYSPSGPISWRSRSDFNVHDAVFFTQSRLAKTHMEIIGHNGHVSALSNADRKNRYVLVDSDGEAWRPTQHLARPDEVRRTQDMKEVLGNIRNEEDYDLIVSSVLPISRYRDTLERPDRTTTLWSKP